MELTHPNDIQKKIANRNKSGRDAAIKLINKSVEEKIEDGLTITAIDISLFLNRVVVTELLPELKKLYKFAEIVSDQRDGDFLKLQW